MNTMHTMLLVPYSTLIEESYKSDRILTKIFHKVQKNTNRSKNNPGTNIFRELLEQEYPNLKPPLSIWDDEHHPYIIDTFEAEEIRKKFSTNTIRLIEAVHAPKSKYFNEKIKQRTHAYVNIEVNEQNILSISMKIHGMTFIYKPSTNNTVLTITDIVLDTRFNPLGAGTEQKELYEAISTVLGTTDAALMYFSTELKNDLQLMTSEMYFQAETAFPKGIELLEAAAKVFEEIISQYTQEPTKYSTFSTYSTYSTFKN